MLTTTTTGTHPLATYDWSLAHFGLLDFNPTVYCLISSLLAVALWMVIDLTAQVHFTFKRYYGGYYWCLVTTTWGIGFHAIAFVVKLFVPLSEAGEIGVTALAKIGWVLNTTGFSLVLYSRLNLVVRSQRLLQVALGVIIADAVLLHTPIVVFSFGLSTRNSRMWVPYMEHMERIQVIGFTLQDLALSTVYTWTAAHLLKDRSTPAHRNLFIALLFAQTFGFVADTAMVVLDYENMFTLKTSLHPFIYALKLKIEFIVLNQLAGFFHRPDSDFFVYWSAEDPSLGKKRESLRSLWSRRMRYSYEKNPCDHCRVVSNSNLSEDLRRSCRPPDVRTSTNLSPLPPTVLRDIGVLVSPGRTLSDPLVVKNDRFLDDLERQYLGKFDG